MRTLGRLDGTELAMLVGAEDSPVPLFDSTAIHAARAAAWALAPPPESKWS